MPTTNLEECVPVPYSLNGFLCRYDIAADTYRSMWHRQGGRCVICRQRVTSGRLAVDHDHKRGHVRGLLCSGCNVAIGHMKDDPERLRAAADYLERDLEHNEVKVYFVDPATLS